MNVAMLNATVKVLGIQQTADVHNIKSFSSLGVAQT